MPAETPTKWQAQAYRFGVRRLESAVTSGDALLRSDPLRRRLNISLLVSIALAALILGVFAIIGLVSPEPRIGNSPVVVDDDTGGAFVNRNGTLYPAMNLASALLAAGQGSNASPPAITTVGDDQIGAEPRGPQLGIPGAPNVLSHKLIPSSWTVCDTTTVNPALAPGSAPSVRTTAIVGEPRPSSGAIGSDAMLVHADGASDTFLVFDGRRAVIDPNDRSIRLAFGFAAGVTARPISSALLNAIPQSKRIVAPAIPGQGTTNGYTRALGVRVGEVFALQKADRSTQVYVALSDGVEKITPLLGNLIRDEFSQLRAVPLVEPVALKAAPVTANPIDTTIYPATQPDLIAFDDFATVCVARSGTDTEHAGVYRFTRVPLPDGAKPVPVTVPGQLTADQVYVRPGRAGVFESVQPTQSSGSGRPLFLVTDDGVAYPVVSQVALSLLGYSPGDAVDTAPELIELLPAGPTLDPDTAVHFFPQTGASASGLPPPTAASSAQG